MTGPLPNVEETDPAPPDGVRRSFLIGARRLIPLVALVAWLLTLAPAAQGRVTDSLTLDVTFSATGTISVTLPDGTPIGTTSGAPTVIPAGYYTVVLSGPGGCAYLPLFELQGPGVNILNDMVGGETNYLSMNAYFAPNSTYTWLNNSNRSAVYTFVTSANVVGSSPAPAPHAITSGTQGTVSSQDVVGSTSSSSQEIVGSTVIPFRGTLVGAVSATGTLALSYKGKGVTSLRAGRYTLNVTDKSETSGFALEKANRVAARVTGVGTRSVMVDLSAGRWTVIVGKRTYAIIVLPEP